MDVETKKVMIGHGGIIAVQNMAEIKCGRFNQPRFIQCKCGESLNIEQAILPKNEEDPWLLFPCPKCEELRVVTIRLVIADPVDSEKGTPDAIVTPMDPDE